MNGQLISCIWFIIDGFVFQKYGFMFRNLVVKFMVWRGKAVDVWSKSTYPANVLSNLYNNGFIFDGVICNSMEGFLQSLKQKDSVKQRQICGLEGKEAKKMSSVEWQNNQIVYWKGQAINRQSEMYLQLVRRAYRAMLEQNKRFSTALMATQSKRLYHSRGEKNPYKTILTEQEFCNILTELRKKFQKAN